MGHTTPTVSPMPISRTQIERLSDNSLMMALELDGDLAQGVIQIRRLHSRSGVCMAVGKYDCVCQWPSGAAERENLGANFQNQRIRIIDRLLASPRLANSTSRH